MAAYTIFLRPAIHVSIVFPTFHPFRDGLDYTFNFTFNLGICCKDKYFSSPYRCTAGESILKSSYKYFIISLALRCCYPSLLSRSIFIYETLT
jgi:hypothetical protein